MIGGTYLYCPNSACREYLGSLGSDSCYLCGWHKEVLAETDDDPESPLGVMTADRDILKAAIKKVHAAKGRHHSQIAMCDLFDLANLPCVRPAIGAKEKS